jgi:hypothetical protein
MMRKLIVRRTRARPRLWTTTRTSVSGASVAKVAVEANLWNRARTGSLLDQADVGEAASRGRAYVVQVVDWRKAGRMLNEEGGSKWVPATTGTRQGWERAPDETFAAELYISPPYSARDLSPWFLARATIVAQWSPGCLTVRSIHRASNLPPRQFCRKSEVTSTR